MTTPTEKPAAAGNPSPFLPHDAELLELLPEFKPHRLNADGLARTDAIRQAMSYALAVVAAAVPKGCRELSITVTKMQEACMFAVLAVAVEPSCQER